MDTALPAFMWAIVIALTAFLIWGISSSMDRCKEAGMTYRSIGTTGVGFCVDSNGVLHEMP